MNRASTITGTLLLALLVAILGSEVALLLNRQVVGEQIVLTCEVYTPPVAGQQEVGILLTDNAGDYQQPLSYDAITGARFQVYWNTVPGGWYVIQYKTTIDGQWRTVNGVRPGTGGQLHQDFPLTSHDGALFVRVYNPL